MIFTHLRLTHFARFYGEQRVEFGPGVYVVHGRNGLGKTTLLNAIRWCLYGRYNDRQGRPVPPEVMLNRAAEREGARQLVVELGIEDGSDRYLVRRTQVVASAATPASELYVERNSSPLTAADSKRAIDRLLYEDVARFFLFDGEQLQQYESLLIGDSTQSQLIKQSIEQILGLPVLEQGLVDLAAVRDEFSRRLTRQSRADARLQQIATRAEQTRSDLSSKKNEISELDALKQSELDVVAARDAFLQRYEGSIESVRRLDVLEAELRTLTERESELAGFRGSALAHVWRDVLHTAIAPTLSQLGERSVQQQEATARETVIDLQHRALEDGTCPICSRVVDEAVRAGLVETQRDKESVTAFGADEAHQMLLLSAITDSGHLDQSVELDRRMAELRAHGVTRRQEAGRLRAALEEAPTSEVSTAAMQRDQAQQEIGRLEERLRTARAEAAELEASLRRAETELRAAGAGADASLARCMTLVEGLMTVFGGAKERFRDELRDAVALSASDVFRQLISEPAYAGLRINDSYGLEIVNDEGDIVTGRSAGQEQLVALSLMAALNHNATRRAPVVMDTPFGRLDPVHRVNVLRYLTQMSEQVFLLVHGGEVTDADLSGVAGLVQGEFSLEYDDPERTSLGVRSRL